MRQKLGIVISEIIESNLCSTNTSTKKVHQIRKVDNRLDELLIHMLICDIDVHLPREVNSKTSDVVEDRRLEKIDKCWNEGGADFRCLSFELYQPEWAS
jgi:hypothetical protein